MKHEIASILRDAADRIAAIEDRPAAPAPDKPPHRRRWGVMGTRPGLAPGEYVSVIEVRPGDPTSEHVQALVRVLENAFTFRVSNHPTWEDQANRALAPFRKP